MSQNQNQKETPSNPSNPTPGTKTPGESAPGTSPDFKPNGPKKAE